jgi:hypothetical protein
MADACHTSAFSQRFKSILSLIGRGSGIAAAQAAIAAKKSGAAGAPCKCKCQGKGKKLYNNTLARHTRYGEY